MVKRYTQYRTLPGSFTDTTLCFRSGFRSFSPFAHSLSVTESSGHYQVSRRPSKVRLEKRSLSCSRNRFPFETSSLVHVRARFRVPVVGGGEYLICKYYAIIIVTANRSLKRWTAQSDSFALFVHREPWFAHRGRRVGLIGITECILLRMYLLSDYAPCVYKRVSCVASDARVMSKVNNAR